MPQPVGEVKYVFVWSEVTAEEPKSYQSSSCIRIRNALDQSEDDSTWLCNADFKWGPFEAEFTCYYHPSADTFSDFEMVEHTGKGGMENIEEVIISFHRELDDERVEIVDDNGNIFMFVQIKLGWDVDIPLSADIWGKRALLGERNVKVAKLSEKERENLELDRWDEEQRNAHFALVAEHERKASERDKVEEGLRDEVLSEAEGNGWEQGWKNGGVQEQGGNGPEQGWHDGESPEPDVGRW
jgi:hypothetical protein